MATECAEIPLALVHLQIFFGRFQAIAHKNLYHFVLQWRPCWLSCDHAPTTEKHLTKHSEKSYSQKIGYLTSNSTLHLIKPRILVSFTESAFHLGNA